MINTFYVAYSILNKSGHVQNLYGTNSFDDNAVRMFNRATRLSD
jgi:hypothetical protein